MDLAISDKVAFIAASSDGLGKAVALELANEGVSMVICGRDLEKLNKAAAEITRAGAKTVLPIQADLTKSKDRERLINETLEKFQRIDILITNSGGPPTGLFESIDPKEIPKAFEQLFISTTDLIRGFLPGMKTQHWGRIITITSQAVKQPVDNLILSNSIRASVVGLMKTLASELGQYNITVNNLMPGYTKTSRLENLIHTNPGFQEATSEIPLQRFAEPHEFASAVAFIASNKASYITGVSLPVDGGWIRST